MRLAGAVPIAEAAAGVSAVPFTVHAQSARVAVPGTPVGTVLRAWLDAFNSGDSLRPGAYYRQYGPVRLVLPACSAERLTGGFDPIALERTGPRQIEVTLKVRTAARFAYTIITTPPDGSTRADTF
jgi:hypothetical protein